MIPHTLSARIALGLYVALCLVVLRIGGTNERVAGGAMLVQVLLDNLMHDHVHGGPQYWSAAFDVALLAVLGAIALNSQRAWPLWASGFQLVSTLVHGIKALDPTVHGWAYLSASTLFGWFTLAAVLVGAWAARRRATEARSHPP